MAESNSMSRLEMETKAVAKGAGDNTLDCPPVFWGIRSVCDVADMGVDSDFDVFFGEFLEKDYEKAHETANRIDSLYAGADGESIKSSSTSLRPRQSNYENSFLVKDGKPISAYVLDFLNAKYGQREDYSMNGLLRHLLLLTTKRKGVWDVKKSGDFTYEDSVRIRGELFPTEEIPVKCHIFIRYKEKTANILNMHRSESGRLDPPDEKAEYERLKSLRENSLEPGINNVAALLELTEQNDVKVLEVYLDGDRMVLE